jgi:hypothetical protein
MIRKLNAVHQFAWGMLVGVVLGLVMAPSGDDYPVRIPCPDPVVSEDDACVVVPLWAVDSKP